MPDNDVEYQKYVKDPRIPCKYGVKCYQKNPAHHQKYKHPPGKPGNKQRHIAKKRKTEKQEVTTKQDVSESDSDNYNIEDSDSSSLKDNQKVSNDVSESETSDSEALSKSKVSDSDSENEGDTEQLETDGVKKPEKQTETEKSDVKGADEVSKTETPNKIADLFKRTSVNSVQGYTKHADFIKEKFLVLMPNDFYDFWNFCKVLKHSNPIEALKEIGLTLVGPFDVLAGKFENVTKSSEEFLTHWRYYRDPPEFQTVLKGDDKTGYHIGYFRDSPTEVPVFLCNNQSKKDGVLTAMGENIFAAVNFYLEDLKKTGDPFKKMHIGRIQIALKKEADKLKYNLSKKTNAMVIREKKIVTRTFNKIGLVVPFDKKTEVGYRELALDNKALNILLTKLQNVHSPEEKAKFRSELQPVFTFASIAADECDFGTGIELGWNLIAHGVDGLDTIISDFLSTGYKLLNKEEFAKISEAHMKNRRKGTSLSVL